MWRPKRWNFNFLLISGPWGKVPLEPGGMLCYNIPNPKLILGGNAYARSRRRFPRRRWFQRWRRWFQRWRRFQRRRFPQWRRWFRRKPSQRRFRWKPSRRWVPWSASRRWVPWRAQTPWGRIPLALVAPAPLLRRWRRWMPQQRGCHRDFDDIRDIPVYMDGDSRCGCSIRK